MSGLVRALLFRFGNQTLGDIPLGFQGFGSPNTSLIRIHTSQLLVQTIYFSWNYITHSGSENLKKSRPKKLVKSNKSISRNFYWKNSFFAISKIAKNQFLNWENCQNNVSSRKFFFYFTSFFAWTFLNWPTVFLKFKNSYL